MGDGLYTDKRWVQRTWWVLGILTFAFMAGVLWFAIQGGQLGDAPGLPKQLQQKRPQDFVP